MVTYGPDAMDASYIELSAKMGVVTCLMAVGAKRHLYPSSSAPVHEAERPADAFIIVYLAHTMAAFMVAVMVS